MSSILTCSRHFCSMKHIIIGTAGHVDHGKTWLIKSLSGIDTDRLKEEKKRGITIDLGFAYMSAPDGSVIGIIDVPGHEKFIRNMLAGIGGIDIVLLVVAADEGVMPQTLEHLEIMSLLDIKQGIIVITKADLADEEWLQLVESDVREAVAGTFLEDSPCMRVSALTGEGMAELRELVYNFAAQAGDKNNDPAFLRIPIDRVFTMQGFGTVITGTLTSGMLESGTEVGIYPQELKAKVRSIEVHGKSVERAYAGQRTAVNLSNIDKDQIERGNVIAAEGSVSVTDLIDVKIINLKDSQRVIEDGSRLHLHYGAAETLCRVVLLEGKPLSPGDSGYAQLMTAEPIAVRSGDLFVLRYFSPVETVGGGRILNARPAKHKRKDEAVLAALRLRESGSVMQKLEQTMRDEAREFPDISDLSLRLGISREETGEMLRELAEKKRAVRLDSEVYAHIDYVNTVRDAAFGILDEYYDKNPLLSRMPREEFRSKLLAKLRTKDAKALDRLLGYLIGAGDLDADSASLAKGGYKVEFSEVQRKLMDELAAMYKSAAHESPDIEELLVGRKDKAECRKLIDAMCAEGRLTRLSGTYCMDSEVLENIVAQVKAKIELDGFVTLAELRDKLGTSRKYALLILEYCDSLKLTVLQGDRRVFY